MIISTVKLRMAGACSGATRDFIERVGLISANAGVELTPELMEWALENGNMEWALTYLVDAGARDQMWAAIQREYPGEATVMLRLYYRSRYLLAHTAYSIHRQGDSKQTLRFWTVALAALNRHERGEPEPVPAIFFDPCVPGIQATGWPGPEGA